MSKGYIFHLRGTSGSGKTYVAQHLFKVAKAEPIFWKDDNTKNKVEIYEGVFAGKPLYILGDYSPTRSAGGCDTIATIPEVIRQVKDVQLQVLKRGHNVFLEGLLLAHSWGEFGEYAHKTFGDHYLNLFLDTPMQKCYDRVVERRESRGADNLDIDRMQKILYNVEADYHRVELCWARVEARGGVRKSIPHKTAPASVEKLMEKYIWTLPH